jgi:hypothetical protein
MMKSLTYIDVSAFIARIKYWRISASARSILASFSSSVSDMPPPANRASDYHDRLWSAARLRDEYKE